MINPPVIDKTLVDINVAAGIDESVSPEDMNWQGGVLTANNVVVNGSAVETRQGLDLVGAALKGGIDNEKPFYLARLGSVGGGLAVLGVGGDSNFWELRYLNRFTEKFQSKGLVPEFKLTPVHIGADQLWTGSLDNPALLADYQDAGEQKSGVTGLCMTSKYIAICHTVRQPNSTYFPQSATYQVQILDRTSFAVVYTLTGPSVTYVPESTKTSDVLATMVSVSDRYIHVWYGNHANSKPGYVVIDTESIDTEAADAIVASGTIASAAVGDWIGGVAQAPSSAGSFGVTNGAQVWLTLLTPTGTVSTQTQLTDYAKVTGIDAKDYIYLSGIAGSSFDPATLALTGWWRGNYGGQPWLGTASAGPSTNYRLGEATNPPAVGAALNGFTPANFDGTNDKLRPKNAASVDQAGAVFLDADGWTILVLFNADTANSDIVPSPFNNAPLFGDSQSSGGWGVTFSTAGVVAHAFDSAQRRVAKACGTGGWHLAKVRYTGTQLQCEIDSGTLSSNQVGLTTTTFLGSTIDIGLSGTSQIFDGRIMEIMVTDYSMTDTEINNVKGYMNTRYGLSL